MYSELIKTLEAHIRLLKNVYSKGFDTVDGETTNNLITKTENQITNLIKKHYDDLN